MPKQIVHNYRRYGNSFVVAKAKDSLVRAMVYAEPPCALRFSRFHAKAWNVEGARYYFPAAGFLDSEGPADSKIEE